MLLSPLLRTFEEFLQITKRFFSQRDLNLQNMSRIPPQGSHWRTLYANAQLTPGMALGSFTHQKDAGACVSQEIWSSRDALRADPT